MMGDSISELHVSTKLGKKFTRKSCGFWSMWDRSNNSLQSLLLWLFTFILASLFVQLAKESVNSTCSPRQSFHNNHLLSFTLLLILTTLFTGHKLFDHYFLQEITLGIRQWWRLQKYSFTSFQFLRKIQACLLFHTHFK